MADQQPTRDTCPVCSKSLAPLTFDWYGARLLRQHKAIDGPGICPGSGTVMERRW